MFQVQATVTKRTRDSQCTSQIPTFFLDPNIQGITCERHAVQVALLILNPTKDPALDVAVSIIKV